MARPVKEGLSYFPFDVDFFNDDKIELISAEFGVKGENICIRLLCQIFKGGYYYVWGSDEALLFAKRVGNGITGALVEEVVSGLIKRSFFDKGVFDSFGILTSRGIQKRYLEAKYKSPKKVKFIKEFYLLDVLDAETRVKAELIHFDDDLSTQSKVKKIKVKKNKPKENPGFIPSCETEVDQSELAPGAQNYLVPDMLSIYTTFIPSYSSSPEMDYQPLGAIVNFIRDQEKIKVDPAQNNDASERIKLIWGELCSFISKDSFHKNQNLLTISRHIQTIVQKYRNGKGTNNFSGESINSKIDQLYS